jgi:drug/metabolite transporter (DMT)-like permease
LDASLKNILIGLLTALAFAGNSILNRAALVGSSIDPMSFSFIRILSAACFLGLVLFFMNRTAFTLKGHLRSAVSLTIYVVFFSLAYRHLSGATGALILFAVVQFTLVGFSYVKGVALSKLEWIGLVLALLGVVILLLPGVEKPSYLGFGLMFISGLGWASFTIIGLKPNNAIVDVTLSFIKAVPLAFIVYLFSAENSVITSIGVVYAILSGVLTSGLGYFLWFLLLPSISASSAAAFQLSVPVIVAFMGVVLLGELLNLQMVLASGIVIVGLGLFTFAKLNKQ